MFTSRLTRRRPCVSIHPRLDDLAWLRGRYQHRLIAGLVAPGISFSRERDHRVLRVAGLDADRAGYTSRNERQVRALHG